MATIKLILDPRTKKDGTSAVMIKFNQKHYRKKANLGICVDGKYWRDGMVTEEHPNYRFYNQRFKFVMAAAEGVLLRHLTEDLDGDTLFREIEAVLFPEKVEKRAEKEAEEERKAQEEEEAMNGLLSVARSFTAQKKPSTRLTYERTLKHLEAFVAKGNTDKLDELNKSWLVAFENHLTESNPSPNSRALHFRNLRAILNYAIDEEITTNYPFRRFKIKTVKTAKRNLPIDVMRELLTTEVEEWQEVYRDMFALSFMLMGVNFADMLRLKHSNERFGRLEFNRAKTAKLYSMKIEPEARKLLDKYAGRGHLINIMDSRTDYLQFIRQTNNALRKIGDCSRHGLGGKKSIKAICPDLSTYWARHTWATIAASLDIPKETIAAALGHGGNTVTDIYIEYDRKKVDEANRKVLDWVLYGVRDGKVVDRDVKTAYSLSCTRVAPLPMDPNEAPSQGRGRKKRA